MAYRIFRLYIKFFHNKIFYRHTYVVNKENVPEDGIPLLIVSNHQNCMNDPLCILHSLDRRKANFIARADVFKNPIANRFLRFIGLLPAFRLSYEGEDSLSKNDATFEAAGQELMNGRSVIIYPEAGHQDKRWLGSFSLGYTKLAFEAAQRENFKKEIFILPSCNHYSSYFGMQQDELVKYGTPISLAPYYELFQTKPRTAQRQVNEKVREQTKELMLNIEDLEHYEALDYLRNSYGVKFARENGFRPELLPEKLLADKLFIEKMAQFKERNTELMSNICDKTLEMKAATLNANIRDWNFEKPFSFGRLLLQGILHILTFPVFICTIFPNWVIYFAPKLITRKTSDRMFDNSINFGLSVLLTIPLLYPLSFILCWIISGSLWMAVIYLLTLPLFGLFSFLYYKSFIKWKSEIRFRHRKDRESTKALINLRRMIFSLLDKEMKK
ncbi:MAG TPA: 1-acyl-sn-glycerol-3-phosphate acyltransferase [Paludibacteraceae bacterium]|nr:1-acyl-sn-glycerol-3-phosphate acyltransferase [Paludibacteraceae bacterium]